MTRLFFALIIFWTSSVGFTQSWWMPKVLSCMINSHEIKSSLVLSGFTCTSKSVGLCSYSECVGKIPSYPRPVLVAVPLVAESLRLHFHGHKLGKFPEYEKNLSSMVKSFGLADELCSSKEVVVFPESEGNCTTYDQKLKTKQDFDLFLKEVHASTGHHLKQAPIHVSAHSGGGRTVARFLDSGFKTEKVTIFDGIYSESQKNSLKNWYKLGNGKLTLASVKGMSPDSFSNKLKSELGLKITRSQSTINGSSFDIHQTDRFIHLSRESGAVGALKAHYDVLSQTWKTSN